MGEFRMPALGADMTEGTIVRWYVAPGAQVARGDIVATVDTAKADIDVEVFEGGTVEELLVGVGERVPVGTVLARIGTGVAAPSHPQAPAAGNGRLRASPVARRMAEQLGVDLAHVTGTGPRGAIWKADVERAAEHRPPPPPAPTLPPTPSAPPERSGMRGAIAAAMERSNREIPHYHLATDIDVSAAMAYVARVNAGLRVGRRLVLAALLLKATARAAAEHPDFSAHWVDGALRPAGHVHLGVAIALREGGLINPAIHDADSLSVEETMAALRDLVRRTRSGGLRGSELTDGTLTVTSLGDRGVPAVFGVIYPPQVALVGFGTPVERPWAVDGLLGVRPIVTATLAADHRASDGHAGALFLDTIDRLLQKPEEL